MTFTVHVEYGVGACSNVETTQGFNEMDDAYSFNLINSCTKGRD